MISEMKKAVKGLINRKKAAEAQEKTVFIPVLNMPKTADYKWQFDCLCDRLAHPEKYEKTENVEETIAHLRKWLAEHNEELEAEAV